jgi:hypothetical protein
MSRAVLMSILLKMGILLNDYETEELYRELLNYFGLAGALDDCQALESAWKDPYNRRQIEDFIKAWLRRRRGRKEVAVSIV